MDLTGLRTVGASPVKLMPVAAPDHPLAVAGVSPGRAREHVQLVLMDQPASDGRDWGIVSQAIWRVGDLNLKHQLLLRGTGWGGMPEPMVRADIEAGRLVLLDLDDYRAGEYMLRVMHKVDTPPGPAGRWLIDRLS